MESARQVLGEPQELGRFHLRGNGAADIIEDSLGRGVDAARLRHSTMIHPHDDVAFGIGGGADRQRLSPRAQDHQRAGRVETDACHRLGRDAGPAHRVPRARTDRPPDIVAGLFEDVARFVPQGNVRPGRVEQHPGPVEHAGASAARAHVDTEEVVGGHML